jgi:hypothetical protein
VTALYAGQIAAVDADDFGGFPYPYPMAIECRSRRGRLTLEQSDWLDTLAAAGVDVVVARPGNYDETITTITSGT